MAFDSYLANKQCCSFRIIAINLLNAETVKKAALEIRTGRHVQLDWPMNNVEFPGFGRIPIEHNVKEMEKEGFLGLDDEIKINTQTSSQWDSLKHASLSGIIVYEEICADILI